jgi:hypothetical protein
MTYYMAIVGVICTIIGTIVLIKRLLFLARAHRASGNIVEVVERPRRDKGRTRIYYHPKVAYPDRTGRRHETIGEVGSTSANAFIVGSQIAIRYDPDTPENAIVGNAISIWGLPICLFIIGTAALYGGLKGILNF